MLAMPMQPSLNKHFHQCRGQGFTCIDCCVTFDRKTVGGVSRVLAGCSNLLLQML